MQTTTNYTVILADDHILLRDALGNLINSFEQFTVTQLCANGQELIQAITEKGVPDIIIVDLNMPILDGYKTTEWLAKKHPACKILILTMYDSDIALIRLLQLGVRGFLKKDIHPNELLHAIKTVVEDGYYYPTATGNKMAALFAKDKYNQFNFEKSNLSATEIEFIQLASSDKTYKEIAMEMKISTRNVDNLRDTLFEKLSIKSRVSLAIFAIKNGLVNL
jgi:two-component system, NarL family, invasion response regulator UvrY